MALSENRWLRGMVNIEDDHDINVCTDAHASFKAFAKAYGLQYRAINASKGQRVLKKIYHIQNANNAHMRLKKWMDQFNGVATKYLDNYMQWFSLLEETKSADRKEQQFAERSLYRVRDWAWAFNHNILQHSHNI